MMCPKVSVILPIYDVERYLKRCLDSVVLQTLKDIEIILATDGPEACDKICAEYAEKDDRIKIISHCGSYGKSCNTAMQAAKGEYIGFVECDDWCSPTMFERLYETAQNEKADICKSGWWDAFDNPKKNKRRIFYKTSRLVTAQDAPDFLREQPSIWSAIYRTEFLRSHHIFMIEEKMSYIDTPFFIETFLRANKLAYLSEPLYFYYQDNPDASVKSSKHVLDSIYSEEFTYKKIKTMDCFTEKLKNQYVYTALCRLMWHYGRLSEQNDCKTFWAAAHSFVQHIDLQGVDLTAFHSDDLLRFFQDLHKTPDCLHPFCYYQSCSRKYIRFWKLPLLLIEQKNAKRRYKLFNFITLFSIRYHNSFKQYKTFGLKLYN